MPQRRCVGCGRGAPKSELMRLAVSDQRAAGESEGRVRLAVLDRSATMPGRGAYLCRDALSGRSSAACVALATQRGGLARALRCSVKVSPELVESTGEWLSQPQAGWPKRGLAPQARVTRLRSGRVGPDKFPIIR